MSEQPYAYDTSLLPAVSVGGDENYKEDPNTVYCRAWID